jgi:hypothetical protein
MQSSPIARRTVANNYVISGKMIWVHFCRACRNRAHLSGFAYNTNLTVIIVELECHARTESDPA